jgi:hypothetical protein
MPLKLKEVSLVCFETRNVEAALISMSYSLSQIKFSQSILFTTSLICSSHFVKKANHLGIKIELIPEIRSISEYSYFILTELEKYIHTQFCLVTQWDGWVINYNAWDSEFLKYDYIGAIWPEYSENQIGNGGFSLRSKKLLKSTKELLILKPNFLTPLIEDDFICRNQRGFLEENYKIKFPSIEIANKFSFEGNRKKINTFGFHGMSNFNYVIRKDFDLKNLISILSDDYFTNRESYNLVKFLISDNRISVAKLVIKRRLKANHYSKKHFKLICLLLIRNFLNIFKP